MVLTAVDHHIQKMIDSLLQTHLLISRSVPYFPEQKRNFIVDDTDDQLGQGSVIIAVKEWLGDAYSLEYVLESGSLSPRWDSISRPTVSKSRPTCSLSTLV